ncbi:hypothetical protein Rhopal_007870-T1 [Rhodotorula paludigena]|uniref:SUR7 protein n=1 Tax=Rhodotorula paludigena TaxID=86838 RepID=A0AAV5H232_9BASI|nr:hypothetical protein Rhopal_007870-T1 [Rhodotorula paludigena]
MPNFCAGLGLTFSFAAVILLVFAQISQINSDLIPRHLRLVHIDTSGLATALSSAAKASPVPDLANANYSDIFSSQVVGDGYFVKKTDETLATGVRKSYEWGLWSYCTTNGDEGDARSYCYTRSIHPSFQPAKVLLEDIPAQYSALLKDTLPENVFTADNYLGTYTQAATYCTMVGSLALALAALIGLFARKGAFVLSSLLSIVAFLALAVGTIIYQVIFARARVAINDATTAGTDVGITLDYGNALWILWAATVLTLFSILPLSIACCTGRKDVVVVAPPPPAMVSTRR